MKSALSLVFVPEYLVSPQGVRAFTTGAVRVESGGVFVADRNVADLGQIVDRIARTDVVEIRNESVLHPAVARGALIGLATGIAPLYLLAASSCRCRVYPENPKEHAADFGCHPRVGGRALDIGRLAHRRLGLFDCRHQDLVDRSCPPADRRGGRAFSLCVDRRMGANAARPHLAASILDARASRRTACGDIDCRQSEYEFVDRRRS